MSTVTIPCPHCQQVMAVGHDLAGQKVRCPHCQAELAAPGETPAEPLPPVEEPFQFHRPSREMEDSIFGEAADSWFGAPAPNSPGPAVAPVLDPAASNSAPRVGQTEGRRVSGILLAIIVPYAVLMTVVAITYFKKSRDQDSLHPLELIPDLIGEYRNSAKKSGSRSLYLPPAAPDPNRPFPPHLTTALGKPIVLGDLEVTPLKIEQRPLVAYRLKKDSSDPEKIVFGKDSLVLHLKLRNISKDVEFQPTDPFFDRRPRDGSDKPYTLIEVRGKAYFGGVIEYVTETGHIVREWLEGQEDDTQPLKPGDERRTVVATHPKEPVIEALGSHEGKALWRVHLRRGLYNFKGNDLSMTGVVGVEFTADDVSKPIPADASAMSR